MKSMSKARWSTFVLMTANMCALLWFNAMSENPAYGIPLVLVMYAWLVWLAMPVLRSVSWRKLWRKQ